MGNVLPNLNESIFSCFQIPLSRCSCNQVQIEMLNVILFHFVSAYNTVFKPADSVGGAIPIETCVAVCPFVTTISPSILARSLQKFYTIKNRYSIHWLVLGVTIR